MEFRDLSSFNTALLAKQCWRILQDPNSFWIRVLKARYFPNCDFKDAERGFRASWSWSSLLDARDLILKGSTWQVINGTEINIWKDNWLPPPFTGPLVAIAPIPDHTPSMVSSLIDWDRKAWDLS